MSRIGRLPIAVPAGVTVTVNDENLVTVKGPKGTLCQQVNKAITVKKDAGVLTVERHAEDAVEGPDPYTASDGSVYARDWHVDI